jgi:hypothetical protein
MGYWSFITGNIGWECIDDYQLGRTRNICHVINLIIQSF